MKVTNCFTVTKPLLICLHLMSFSTTPTDCWLVCLLLLPQGIAVYAHLLLYPWLSLCIQLLRCPFFRFNSHRLCFRLNPKHSMDKGAHNNILFDSSCFTLSDSCQYRPPSSNFYPKPHVFTRHSMESRMTWHVKLSLVLKDLMTSFSPCPVSPSATRSAVSHQEALNSEHHLKLFLSLCPLMQSGSPISMELLLKIPVSPPSLTVSCWSKPSRLRWKEVSLS